MRCKTLVQIQIQSHASDPTASTSFCRALEEADSITSERFLKLQDVALQQCQETDESDLQRLRKHFKTLKNTFTVYDLKEGFIDGKIVAQALIFGPEQSAAATSHPVACLQGYCKGCLMAVRRTSCTSSRRRWRGTVSCCGSTSLTMSR